MAEKGTAFGHYHPAATFAYFLSVMFVTVFTMNPIVIALSFFGALLFSATLESGKEFGSSLVFCLTLIAVLSLANPLFSHNGSTLLFFVNGLPITLESFLYGIDAAVMIAAVLTWSRCLSIVMTSDKVICLFGRFMPKTALTVSMSLRLIPLLKRKWQEIKDSGTANGMFSENRISARICDYASLFSALVTWALENAVDTGASMRARGFGLRGRSSFNIYKFAAPDFLLLAYTALFSAAAFVLFGVGYLDFEFYPRLSQINLSTGAVIFYTAFALFCILPSFTEITEDIKWKYFRSKI